MKTFIYNLTYGSEKSGVDCMQGEIKLDFNADCEAAMIIYMQSALIEFFGHRVPDLTGRQIFDRFNLEDPEVLAVQFSDCFEVSELTVYDPPAKAEFKFSEMVSDLGLDQGVKRHA